ncbi:hypothetical protein FGO68_gene14022 [Halteria grandinella]|uniref:Uncharacterized protein n=1 Tax=Halteria grandinella TaxID=5974 RepID=A0A8J8SUQ2_HALGN|nr:hypothetical protein FGO68_gene14022 [Halteria grandinella]
MVLYHRNHLYSDYLFQMQDEYKALNNSFHKQLDQAPFLVLSNYHLYPLMEVSSSYYNQRRTFEVVYNLDRRPQVQLIILSLYTCDSFAYFFMILEFRSH